MTGTREEDYGRHMLGASPQLTPVPAVKALVSRMRDWPVAAQQHARRNAMVAATACAQRRIEREEVADFLRRDDERRTTSPDAPTVDRAAHL